MSKGAVSKWLARVAEEGKAALKSRLDPSGQSKLSAGQLARGVEAYGFRGTVWTRARICQVIEEEFGVTYHVDQMSFLMQKIGWTQQQPQRVATQQNPAAVAAWQAKWAEVEKSPRRRTTPSVQ